MSGQAARAPPRRRTRGQSQHLGKIHDTNVTKKSQSQRTSAKGLEIGQAADRHLRRRDREFQLRVLRVGTIGYEGAVQKSNRISSMCLCPATAIQAASPRHDIGPLPRRLGLTYSSGLPNKNRPAGWGWSYMDDTGACTGRCARHRPPIAQTGRESEYRPVADGGEATARRSRADGFPTPVKGRRITPAGYPPGKPCALARTRGQQLPRANSRTHNAYPHASGE